MSVRCRLHQTPRGLGRLAARSEGEINDNNKGDAAGFWSLQSMSWSRAAFPSRRSSVRKPWCLPAPFQPRRRCY
jgi:hypothetical protein